MDAVSYAPDRRATVLAVIPCLNEALHLETVATQIIADAEGLDLHLVIADGGSIDGTIAIAERLAARHPQITLMNNERKIQSVAVNRAVVLYGDEKDYLIRVDAHCGYPHRYCQRLVDAQRESNAASVVVSMRAEGTGCFQRAAAAAQNSRLGNGGSAHRLSADGRFVDHGHHALMCLSAFRAVDGYDETFTHNEDSELDRRLTAAGFKIWLAGDATVAYFPRRQPLSLLRQYLNYGRGRARTVFKHRMLPRPRQALPLAVAPAAAFALFSPIHPIFAVPFLTWAAVCLGYGAAIGLRSREWCAGYAGVAAMFMHLGWSLGFLHGSVRMIFNRKQNLPTAARHSTVALQTIPKRQATFQSSRSRTDP